jgi:hypothetical protein
MEQRSFPNSQRMMAARLSPAALYSAQKTGSTEPLRVSAHVGDDHCRKTVAPAPVLKRPSLTVAARNNKRPDAQ